MFNWPCGKCARTQQTNSIFFIRKRPIRGSEPEDEEQNGKRKLELEDEEVRITISLLICTFLFLAGFFGSSFFLSQSPDDVYGVRPRARFLDSTTAETEYNLLTSGESGDNSITSIPFQVLSWKPRALYFPNFASAEGETEENTKGIRTSAAEDKTGTLDVIEEKIARATKISRNHGEAFNILRYEIEQKHASHYDAFNPVEYGPQKSQRPGEIILRLNSDATKTRPRKPKMTSFLLYLSDVLEVGETVFPFENGLNMDSSYSCEDRIGLRVRPGRGYGLLYYSLFPNGTIDPISLHGSCPVIKGQKWVATKWIRDQELDDGGV